VGVEVPVPAVPPWPVTPESPSGSDGDSVGVSLPVSVGVGLDVGEVVGVGDAVGVGDVVPTVGVADALGTPSDVGVGVADGVGVAHDRVGEGDGVGDGRADRVRLRTSISAFSWLAEVGVLATVGAARGDEGDSVLVTSVVTLAVQVAEVVGRGDAAPPDEVAPAPRLAPPAPVGVASVPCGPVPLFVCEPFPSVRAPPLDWGARPLRTVLLAWMIAWRKGCTPSETLAMIATTASTPTGRSQLTSIRAAVRADRAGPSLSSSPGRGRRRSRGNGNCGTRCSPRPADAGSAAGHAQLQCQDQCPRQTQCLAAPRVSAPALSSQGRGGRLPILARIRSSPSAPGWICPTTSARPRRSASSMPSGVVMPSPARSCRPRHDVSWVSIALSDAMALAV
jgi:hypothetical protein